MDDHGIAWLVPGSVMALSWSLSYGLTCPMVHTTSTTHAMVHGNAMVLPRHAMAMPWHIVDGLWMEHDMEWNGHGITMTMPWYAMP